MAMKSIEKNTECATPSAEAPLIDTPDWLRSFKGCEDYTDEEANEIIASLGTLAEVLLSKNVVKKKCS